VPLGGGVGGNVGGGRLGWEFRFLVPISGTPIGSGIPLPFSIPKITVEFFFMNSAVENWGIGILIPKFGIPKINWHRNSILVISRKTSIVIGQPVDLMMLNPMDVGTISGEAIFVPIHHVLNMSRCDFCGLNDHATKLTFRVLKMSRCDFFGMIILPGKIKYDQVE
jgi:hypothetical protein